MLTEQDKQRMRDALKGVSQTSTATSQPSSASDVASSWEAFDKMDAELKAKQSLIEAGNKQIASKNDNLFKKTGDFLQKNFLKPVTENFVSPLAREFERPMVSVVRGVQGLVPGGKTGNEPMETPFGQVKPYSELSPSEAAKGVLELGSVAPGKKVAEFGEKLASPLAARAEKLYMSYLKPSKSLLAKNPDVIKTALKEGVTVSPKGLNKVSGIIENIGSEIGDVIDQGVAAGKTVAKKDLLPYLDDMKEYFSNVIGGDKMVLEVEKLGKKALDGMPDLIPIDQAQKIKQTTQNFVKKYYAKETPVPFEVKKQLARGLKDKIAEAVPEISALNARDRKLIGLEEALTDAVTRLGKRDLINLGDITSFFGSAMLKPGSPAAAGVAGNAIYKILKSPTFGSTRAILYKKMADNAGKLLAAGKYPALKAVSSLMEALDNDSESDISK